jgi:hypothetical protein
VDRLGRIRDAVSNARAVAEFLAGKMNNPGTISERRAGEHTAVTFAAASPTGDGIVTVIVIPAAYAVRSENDPLDQELFPWP